MKKYFKTFWFQILKEIVLPIEFAQFYGGICIVYKSVGTCACMHKGQRWMIFFFLQSLHLLAGWLNGWWDE